MKNIDESKVLTIKTGSAAVFHMTYQDDQDPPQPIPLNDLDISMDFINPKTRTILARCYTKIGAIASDGTILEEEADGISVLDPLAGTYEVDAGDTIFWPLGDIPVDIKYTKGGKSQHTETFAIRIIKGQTA